MSIEEIKKIRADLGVGLRKAKLIYEKNQLFLEIHKTIDLVQDENAKIALEKIVEYITKDDY